MLDTDQLQNHIRTLEQGDETARRQAIQSLKQHNAQEWATASDKVAHSLVKALGSQLRGDTTHPSVRQDVAIILGNLGPRSELAVPQLVELLQGGNPDGVREIVATALGKIGKAATAGIDQLLLLLPSPRATLVIQAVRALSAIGCADSRVRTALVELWLSNSQPPKIKAQVAIALCKLKIDAKGLVRFLSSTLVTSPDGSLRKASAEALAWCKQTEVDVVPALLTAVLHDKEDEVRHMGQAGLEQLGLSQDEAIRLCTKQLRDSAYAEAALRHSGEPAIPALTQALKAADSSAREKAARILGGFGELAVAAVPALTKALHDKDLHVRLAVAKGLWKVGKNADVVVPVLVDLLDTKGNTTIEAGEPRRRFLQSVLESLGRIGPPASAAASALTPLVKDKDRHVSESALQALKEIAPAVATKVKLR